MSSNPGGGGGGPIKAHSLKFDPFLTRVSPPPTVGTGTGDLQSQTTVNGSQNGEAQPLMSERTVSRKGGEAKLMVLPTACCMMTQTMMSILAIAVSFNETGHREGYEEGHLDSNDENSGCEVVFYWLIVQACLDLSIACMACLFLVSRLKAEPVGVHGCCATVRMCTLAAGLHILYFAGVKRSLCDKFLIIWSTILVWLGIGIMTLIGCILTCMLLGAVGGSVPSHRPAPRKNMGSAQMMPRPYETVSYPRK